VPIAVALALPASIAAILADALRGEAASSVTVSVGVIGHDPDPAEQPTVSTTVDPFTWARSAFAVAAWLFCPDP
jgi:hypothetical protein